MRLCARIYPIPLAIVERDPTEVPLKFNPVKLGRRGLVEAGFGGLVDPHTDGFFMRKRLNRAVHSPENGGNQHSNRLKP